MYKMSAHNVPNGRGTSRVSKGKSKGSGGSIYVPGAIAMHIHEDARFEPEITQDGILYRFVGYAGEVREKEMPAPDVEWLKR